MEHVDDSPLTLEHVDELIDELDLRFPKTDSDECCYVVLAAGGLGDLCKRCIEAQLKVRVRRILDPPPSAQWCVPAPEPPGLVFPGDAGGVKLAFSLPCPTSREEWMAQHTALAALPWTQGLLAPLAFASGLERSAHGLRQVYAASSAVDEDVWLAAARTWRYCRAAPPPMRADGRADCGLGGVSFRVSAMRDGQHAFESPAVAREVGAALVASRGMQVDLMGYELEVVAVMLQGELLLALNLWRGSKHMFRAKLGRTVAPDRSRSRRRRRHAPARAHRVHCLRWQPSRGRCCTLPTRTPRCARRRRR